MAVGALRLAGAAPDPERWREVEDQLDWNCPGLAEVKAAPAAERPTALLRYYQRRFPFQPLPPGALRADLRRVADEALAHRFKIREAAPSYRGEHPNFDWDTNPQTDPGWLWNFHRHQYWRPLAIAWRATGDERYFREWAAELNSWVDHMFKPGMEDHPGWRDLEVALRLIVWQKRFQEMVGSAPMDERTLVNFLFAYRRQAEMIAGLPPVPDCKLGNFQVTQQYGLLDFALGMPEFRQAVPFRDQAVERLRHYQTVVMLPDGVINELIPGYHSVNLDSFLKCREKCAAAGLGHLFGSEYDDSLQRSITAIMLWSHPDGHQMMAGDTFDFDRNPDRMKRYLAGFPHREDWRYFATRGREGRAPEALEFALNDSGYYGMRSDWTPQGTCLLMKNSTDPRGFFHNHRDNMTFEFSWRGRRLVVDSGAYVYNGNPQWRQKFRGSAAHATVTLDGRDNAARGRLLFQTRAPGVQVTALENRPAPGLLHRRIFFLVKGNYPVILDLLSGTAGGELRAHFQLLPGAARLESERNRMVSDNLTIQGDGSGTVAAEEGFISYQYGVKTARPAFAFVKPKAAGAGQYFATLLLPGEPPEEGTIRLVRPLSGDGIVRNSLELNIAGRGMRLDFDLDRQTVKLAPVKVSD